MEFVCNFLSLNGLTNFKSLTHLFFTKSLLHYLFRYIPHTFYISYTLLTHPYVLMHIYNDHICFNHYSEASCPYSNKSVDSNFSPIDNFDYVNKLRVLTVLNNNFEIDLVPLYDEFMLSKNQIKRKYFQDNFAQSEKNRVKSKWLEKMKQLKKHILSFDFLENHYVSNDEVSKQHLSVIKKIKFC